MKDVIVLVEDNEDDILLTQRAFEKNNVANDMIVLRDGQEAMDWFFREGEYADRPDDMRPVVVLLDLKLPKRNGLEVLREIRTKHTTHALPVVILTSSDEDRDLLQSYELGASSYVRKPVNFKEFIGAVNTLGIYWLMLNKLPSE